MYICKFIRVSERNIEINLEKKKKVKKIISCIKKKKEVCFQNSHNKYLFVNIFQ